MDLLHTLRASRILVFLVILLAPVLSYSQDGTLDTSFDPGTGANNVIFGMGLQSDGKIIIAGIFTSYNNNPANYIARLNPNGSFDNTYNIGTGPSRGVDFLGIQPDGKAYFSGFDVFSFNGTPVSKFFRLNTNGTLDTSFDPSSDMTIESVTQMVFQSDGKIVVYGRFRDSNGFIFNFARLNDNGTIDNTFNVGALTTLQSGVGAAVRDMVIQPEDDKIIIGGSYLGMIGSTPVMNMARLNTDGSVDNTFNASVVHRLDPNVSLGGEGIRGIALQPNGKIIIIGSFLTVNGNTANDYARINTDGSLDDSFSSGMGIQNNTGLSTICLQPDGKIIMGGDVQIFNGQLLNSPSRINSDGSNDTDFNGDSPSNQLGANRTVVDCKVLPDGKILIVGAFTLYDGVSRNRVARINTVLDCGISNLALQTTIPVCNGENVPFTLTFDAIAASGNYDLIATEANADLGIAVDQVLGSITDGEINGTGIQITGEVLATTAEGTINVKVVDRDNDDCSEADPISVIIPACVTISSEPLPTMGQWALIVLGFIVLSAGLFLINRKQVLR